MTVYIDADACPVVDIALAACRGRGIPVVLVCDVNHVLQKEGARTVYVEKGSDSADLRIANMAGRDDLVITQDYGLAALALARGAKALSQNGLVFTQDNIDALLLSRHTAARIRRGGGRPKARRSGQRTWTPPFSKPWKRGLRHKKVSLAGNPFLVLVITG